MSYMRVMVLEVPSSMSWTEFMKNFRATPYASDMKAYKKQKVISGWSLVQVGDHSGMIIVEFDTKAKMNKYLKTMAAVREEVKADTGMQTWMYHGPVKASG